MRSLKAWMWCHSLWPAVLCILGFLAVALPAAHGLVNTFLGINLSSPVPARLLAPALAGVGVALAADYRGDRRLLRLLDRRGRWCMRVARAGWICALTGAVCALAVAAAAANGTAPLAGPVLRNTVLFSALALAPTIVDHAAESFLPPLLLLGAAMLLGRSAEGGYTWWASFLSGDVTGTQMGVIAALWLSSATAYLMAPLPTPAPRTWATLVRHWHHPHPVSHTGKEGTTA